jgi:hypothetical protein
MMPDSYFKNYSPILNSENNVHVTFCNCKWKLNTLVITIISITVQNENVNDSDTEATKWIKRKR